MNYENLRNYNYIGVRALADDENYNIGDVCRESYDWDYENDMSSYKTDNPITLGGTCALNTWIESDDSDEEIEEKLNKAIKNVKNTYVGEIVIIGGNDYNYGADDNEIIIPDAVVIAKII